MIHLLPHSKDMHRSTQKAGMSTPNLERALQLMQDVPKRANDAMTLSMICGYDGNIHTHGQIILQVCYITWCVDVGHIMFRV